MRRCLVSFPLSAVLGLATGAAAAEHPLSDASLRIGYADLQKQSVKLRGAWSGDLPDAAAALAGATLRFSGAYGEGGTEAVPLLDTAWRELPDGRGFKYSDPDGAAGGIKSVQLRPGRNGNPGSLKISGKGVPYLHGATTTRLRVSLELGLDRWCADFAAPSDDGRRIDAVADVPPTRCRPDLVVDTAWLAARLDDPGVQVIDTRASSGGSFIPGALPLRPENLATTIAGIDYEMLPPEDAGPVLSALGLRRDATVVVYGTAPEFDPARVVWSLAYLGHDDVRYLDGGWNAWVADGGPVAAGAPAAATPTSYSATPIRAGLLLDAAGVLAGIGSPPYDSPSLQLVDARSSGEFTTGHVPSAALQPWGGLLSAGFLKSRPELEDAFDALGFDPATTTATYCLVGWRASVTWLALSWLGFDDAKIYDGSWLEWGAGGYPVETGS